MSKYAIITDSTTYFTKEDYKKNGIRRASLNIIDGDNVYKELDVENAFVYELFDMGKKLTTSQPSPGDYLNLYEELIKDGVEKIFVMPISAELSGSYQSARIAMNMLDNPNVVHLFKSKMAAFGNELVLLELLEMTNADKKVDEIITRIETLMETAGLVFTSEDLVSLIRSGRLSRAKAMIGTVLRVKPIVKMINGKLELLASSRTNKKAFDHIFKHMTSTIKEDYKTLYVRVCNHNSEEFALKLKEEILQKYKNVKISMNTYIGPVFNVHLGPRGYGVSWMTE